MKTSSRPGVIWFFICRSLKQMNLPGLTSFILIKLHAENENLITPRRDIGFLFVAALSK